MYRRTNLFLLILLLAVSEAFAEPKLGFDVLALQSRNFNVSSFINVTPRGAIVGSLDNTFGDSLAPIQKVLEELKPEIWRVHILNTTCLHSGKNNCGPYEIVRPYNAKTLDTAIKNRDPRIINPYRERVRLYKNLFSRFPNTKPYLSPALEHELSTQSYRILANAARNVWPGVQLVNNSMGSAESYQGALIEKHGENAQAQLVSPDGEEITDFDIDKWKRTNQGSLIRFVWSRVYNCRDQGAKFIDPRARTNCPEPGELETLAHIADTVPAVNVPRPPCSNPQPFRSPSINKPFAEDKGTGDGRANKPVVIVPVKGSDITVLSIGGSNIGSLKYYGPYLDPGMYRYYSALGSNVSGYEFEKRAKAVSGTRNLYFSVGGRCYGPLLTGRRQGKFR